MDAATSQAARQADTKALGHKDKRPVHSFAQAKKSGDRMLACRYELKYLLTESKAAAIHQYIQPFLEYDRYSKLQRGGMYPIVSLYLDSPDLQLCRETLTGRQNRYKLRIRSYTDEPEYPRFFEIKRRINRVILKSRARVTDEDVPALLMGRPLPPRGYTTDEAALNQFQFYATTIHAGPTVLIRYTRQAFESPSENRVRVTFDRELCYKITDQPEVSLGGSGWQPSRITQGHAILEIKFTGVYPAWLARMAAHFNLEVRSISKFATSMTQAGELGFCGPVRRNGWHG
ncbi:MAG: polyphosphate polymerase domain-containing protein [Sedimentisphaerales bacterium]|nr:polyphosphate polymerase domain-containing protein [Sedimentisphaerales bacterium]